MTRQTSIEAYHQIKNDGLLSMRRMQVYELLYTHGPLTALQLIELFREHIFSSPNSGAIITRLSELRDVGVVQELGTMTCPISGRNVILWDVTDKLPLKLEKPRRTKCKQCNGKGYVEEVQTKMF